jgi:hypothetical protein
MIKLVVTNHPKGATEKNKTIKEHKNSNNNKPYHALITSNN